MGKFNNYFYFCRMQLFCDRLTSMNTRGSDWRYEYSASCLSAWNGLALCANFRSQTGIAERVLKN